MNSDDYLLISGIQHFEFCPRQWAIIHIEQQWAENVKTVDGMIFHERAHDDEITEKRGNLIITRGMRIQSNELGMSGQCDVVEFHAYSNGIRLFGREGLWQPYPVEYKKGAPKESDADIMQLCAQAICLEEMLACRINEGSLFYGEPRRRTPVEFTEELRCKTVTAVKHMHDYYQRKYTPKPKPQKKCRDCSLKDLCLPRLVKTPSVHKYIDDALREVE